MSAEDLNDTIRDLATTTAWSADDLSAIAAEYPEPAFLRFVARYLRPGSFQPWQLAGIYEYVRIKP